MTEINIYFARAMDARETDDIILDDEKYTILFAPIGGVIRNLYRHKDKNPVEDGLNVAHSDLELLKSCDIVLADLSMPDYQYVGCIFEIVHAVNLNIPVILVEGPNKFHERFFFQAYCNYITQQSEDAVEYIRRAYTSEGIEKQMTEMHRYYDQIAAQYIEINRKASKENNIDYTEERESLHQLIKRHAYGNALQIGIGIGDWTRSVCESASHVIGIDQSKNMILQAQENLSSYKNMNFIHGDIFKYKIERKSFDCVILYFFLSLLPPQVQRKLLSIVQDVLKPGGKFITADTKKIRSFSSTGLGRHLLQQRKKGERVFTLYKEHFFGDSLAKLLEANGFKILESSENSHYFSWAVSASAGSSL
jgi:ubiquinone/menaquinone biosynthesis C-methylase UbiE